MSGPQARTGTQDDDADIVVVDENLAPEGDEGGDDTPKKDDPYAYAIEGLTEDDIGGASSIDVAWARRNGWVPRDEWRGDELDWVTAKEFADRGRGVNAVLKRSNEQLLRKVEDQDREFKEFMAGANSRMKRELDERLAAATARMNAAESEEDLKGFKAASNEVTAIKRELAALEQPPRRQERPEDQAAAQEWERANPWYRKDAAKTRVFVAVCAEIRATRSDLVGDTRAFLEEADRLCLRDYASLFGDNMQRPRTTNGRAGTAPTPARKTNGRTFDDLPKPAQEIAIRWTRQGRLKKKEDYLEYYDWDAR